MIKIKFQIKANTKKGKKGIDKLEKESKNILLRRLLRVDRIDENSIYIIPNPTKNIMVKKDKNAINNGYIMINSFMVRQGCSDLDYEVEYIDR